MKFSPWLGSRGYGYAKHPDGLPRFLRRGGGRTAPEDSLKKTEPFPNLFLRLAYGRRSTSDPGCCCYWGGITFIHGLSEEPMYGLKKIQKQNPIF